MNLRIPCPYSTVECVLVSYYDLGRFGDKLPETDVDVSKIVGGEGLASLWTDFRLHLQVG